MRKIAGSLVVCAVMLLVAAAPIIVGTDHTVVKGTSSPKASAITWTFIPAAYGLWNAKLDNDGLRSVVIDVYENSSGFPELLLHQRIRFDRYDAFPTGTVFTDSVAVRYGTIYEVVATPNGPKGSSCVITDYYPAVDEPPVARYAWTVVGNTVDFDGSASTDDTGIVWYSWDFGDSSEGSGMVVSHAYLSPGTYTVTLTVVDLSTQSGSTSESVVVPEKGSGKTYTIYDIGSEPWGEWWEKRKVVYGVDFEITDSSTDGFSTLLFLPKVSPSPAYRGIVYAPYRMAIDAGAIPELSVDRPEFMPVIGPETEGALAEIDIYFQYLYQEWWDSYWVPTWGNESYWLPDIWINRQAADGYDLGVVYTVSMNRQAAEQWLNMPQSADTATWWAENEATYISNWESWILNEGNTRLDIYCGYEWPYDINGGTWMRLTDEPDGTVTLSIGHVATGYEILMTRWLDETKLCNHEPCYEDFSLHATYGPASANVMTDAVCQYSLHAVKANQTANGMAWVWEPNKIDYIFGRPGHPSDFDPYRYKVGDLWAYRTYQSWNAGDIMIGEPARYEHTPTWFNLSAGDSLVFKLPMNPVLGVVPYPPPTTFAIDQLALGNPDPMKALLMPGNMSLGYFVTGWPKETGLDLSPLYDSATKTLTIVGAVDFNNFWHTPTGILYHGAPWIEFDVTP